MKRRNFFAAAVGFLAAMFGARRITTMSSGSIEPVRVGLCVGNATIVVEYRVPWDRRREVEARLLSHGIEFRGMTVAISHIGLMFDREWESWDHHLPTNKARKKLVSERLTKQQYRAMVLASPYFLTEDTTKLIVKEGL